jgi:DNA-directed RNA polymerase subunit M/transcription elongation factor TFIIS
MCAHIVREQLARKFDLSSINTLQEELVLQYCEKAAIGIGLENYPPQDVGLFRLAELVHYASLDQIFAGNVALDAEQDYLRSLYQTHHAIPKKTLADPDTTLATNVDSEKCGNCRSTATLTMAKQTRSSDEPMSFYTFCLKCRHRWRSS